jgi:hypothetical protein
MYLTDRGRMLLWLIAFAAFTSLNVYISATAQPVVEVVQYIPCAP